MTGAARAGTAPNAAVARIATAHRSFIFSTSFGFTKEAVAAGSAGHQRGVRYRIGYFPHHPISRNRHRPLVSIPERHGPGGPAGRPNRFGPVTPAPPPS